MVKGTYNPYNKRVFMVSDETWIELPSTQVQFHCLNSTRKYIYILTEIFLVWTIQIPGLWGLPKGFVLLTKEVLYSGKISKSRGSGAYQLFLALLKVNAMLSFQLWKTSCYRKVLERCSNVLRILRGQKMLSFGCLMAFIEV